MWKRKKNRMREKEIDRYERERQRQISNVVGCARSPALRHGGEVSHPAVRPRTSPRRLLGFVALYYIRCLDSLSHPLWLLWGWYSGDTPLILLNDRFHSDLNTVQINSTCIPFLKSWKILNSRKGRFRSELTLKSTFNFWNK